MDTKGFQIKIKFLFAHENKTALKRIILYGPVPNSVLPIGPKQPKSHILFHKNGSPRDLYIMALLILYPFIDTSIENHQHKDIKKRFPKKELLALLLSTFFSMTLIKKKVAKGRY